jgi:hypothetical protein
VSQSVARVNITGLAGLDPCIEAQLMDRTQIGIGIGIGIAVAFDPDPDPDLDPDVSPAN